MADRTDAFSWTGVTFGLAGLVMFGFANREGKRAKQLQQAHQLPSVAAAKDLVNCLPLLVAARGKAGADRPLHGKICATNCVLIEEMEELSALKQNDRGAWIPEYRLVKHDFSEPSWFITDGGGARLGVEGAFEADLIQGALATSKRFQEGKASTYHRLINRLSGYQPLGMWETERFLPVGTAVTVVGELARASDGQDSMLVRKPCGQFSGRPFYVTTKSFTELQDSLTRTATRCKWMSIGFGTVSLVLMGIQLYRHVRSTIRYRRICKQVAEDERRRRGEKEATDLQPDEEEEDKGKCIVCWDRPADAVFIPCGHVCACLRCCTELNRCPICRKPCSVHRIFLA